MTSCCHSSCRPAAAAAAQTLPAVTAVVITAGPAQEEKGTVDSQSVQPRTQREQSGLSQLFLGLALALTDKCVPILL